jgi:Uma2 family endonuclease
MWRGVSSISQESSAMEYWIVYPEQQAIHQFVLDEPGRYRLMHMYMEDDIAASRLFPELAINLSEVFESWIND